MHLTFRIDIFIHMKQKPSWSFQHALNIKEVHVYQHETKSPSVGSWIATRNNYQPSREQNSTRSVHIDFLVLLWYKWIEVPLSTKQSLLNLMPAVCLNLWLKRDNSFNLITRISVVVIIASVSDLRRKDLGNTVSVLGPVNIAEDL